MGEAFIHVGCLGTSNKSVAVPRQDSIRACSAHAALSGHCNIYVHVCVCACMCMCMYVYMYSSYILFTVCFVYTEFVVVLGLSYCLIRVLSPHNR